MRRSLFTLFALAAFFIPGLLPVTAHDLDGDWEFVLQTEGGERRVLSSFRLENETNVTGKWGDAEVKGTFSGGKLNLSFPFTSHEGNLSSTLVIRGDLKEGKLSGNWQFAEYSGSYVAAKKP